MAKPVFWPCCLPPESSSSWLHGTGAILRTCSSVLASCWAQLLSAGSRPALLFPFSLGHLILPPASTTPYTPMTVHNSLQPALPPDLWAHMPSCWMDMWISQVHSQLEGLTLNWCFPETRSSPVFFISVNDITTHLIPRGWKLGLFPHFLLLTITRSDWVSL